MQVTVGNKPVRLAQEMVIGQGGEAVIYKDPSSPDTYALKIYRASDKKRERKLEAMLSAGFTLPQSSIAPLEAVRGSKGELVGFRMRRLSARYRKLGLIFGDKFSKDHGFTAKVKANLFAAMQRDLSQIHAAGIVIGDINDGNEMVDEVGKGFVWIDMDSVQFAGFPCMAGTQFYLSPDLYNIDLSKAPMFKPEHDWFSFSVLLTRALTNGVHPFKSGLHKKYLSIMDRASHGATVFDTDVSYPSIGLPPEVLSQELLDVLQNMLKRQTRDAFPLAALTQYHDSLIECPSCGIEYPGKRSKCPSCAKTTVLDARAAAKVSGFSVTTLFETKGRVLYAARSNTLVYAVILEGSDLFLLTAQPDTASKKTPIPFIIPKSAQFGMFGTSVVVCPDPSAEQPELYILDAGAGGITLRKQVTTEALAGAQAVFATSDTFLYRIAGRHILCGKQFGATDLLERPVMQVFEGQTWFTAARNVGPNLELLAGFHREAGDMRWFMVRGDGTTFTRFDSIGITPLEPHESLTDHAVYFSRESLMIVRATRKRGTDRVRVDVVNTTDGTQMQTFVNEGSAIGPWERIHGKAYSNGLVMHPTDQGVAREKLADRSLQTLTFTSHHVQPMDDLDRLGGGIMVGKSDRALYIKP